MSTPLYDQLIENKKGAHPSIAPPVDLEHVDLSIDDLVSEIDGCALFADGTRAGTLVPLADFTRARIARALRLASRVLTRFPGIALIRSERARQVDHENHTPEADLGRAQELIAAAGCYLELAVCGSDGWYDQDRNPVPPGGWPWSQAAWNATNDPVRALEIAGALTASAIDSLLTSAAQPNTTVSTADAHIVARM